MDYVTDDGASHGQYTISVADPFVDIDPAYPAAAGSRYVGLDVVATNPGEAPFQVTPNYFYLRDAAGNLYYPSNVYRPAETKLPLLEGQPLAAGDRISGFLGYVVPADAPLVAVDLWPGSSRRVTIVDLVGGGPAPTAAPAASPAPVASVAPVPSAAPTTAPRWRLCRRPPRRSRQGRPSRNRLSTADRSGPTFRINPGSARVPVRVLDPELFDPNGDRLRDRSRGGTEPGPESDRPRNGHYDVEGRQVGLSDSGLPRPVDHPAIHSTPRAPSDEGPSGFLRRNTA